MMITNIYIKNKYVPHYVNYDFVQFYLCIIFLLNYI